MNRIFRRLPLMAKLLLIAVVPIIFIIYLTAQVSYEKTRNLDQIKGYLSRIEQSFTITRLVNQLQRERRYSFDFALLNTDQKAMFAERRVTDSLIDALTLQANGNMKDFQKYTFIQPLDSIRYYIDKKIFTPSTTMHYYTNAIFRFSTLNFPPVSSNEFLKSLDNELTSQKILSEIITYMGIINANVYNILYTRAFIRETIYGTAASYDVMKLYEKELYVKANNSTIKSYEKLRAQPELSQVREYYEKVFSSYALDSTYTYLEWNDISDAALNSLSAFQLKLLTEADTAIREFYKKEETARNRAIVRLIIVSLLLIAFAIYILWIINKTLNELRVAALKIAEGKTDIQLKPESPDAIGSLAESICSIDEKNKALALDAERIGKGDFNISFNPRGPEDLLGNAILQMKESLEKYTRDLENSREEFIQLADMMPQIVWVAEPDGSIAYFNKVWYEVTGMESSKYDNSWFSYLHPEDVGPTLNLWYGSVKTGQAYEVEYRFKIHKTSSYRWFLGRAVPVKDSTGRIIKWFGTTTDIHDQKMQEKSLEVLVAERTLELHRSNEDLQQFAHVASHDLKEPLRKIRTFSNRLQEEYISFIPEKGRTYLQKIQSSSERMSNMIEGILNYSVLNATEQLEETIDLNLVMDGICSDLELLILQKDASITYEKLPRIKGMPTLIYQLFYNLISNSLKFAKQGSACTIRISSKSLSEKELNGYKDLKHFKNYQCITIEDNGIGFNPEYAERMFNVFTRLNRRDQYEGTGLGLALCKKIVHRHHGFINANGEEGVGATFNIVFPLN